MTKYMVAFSAMIAFMIAPSVYAQTTAREAKNLLEEVSNKIKSAPGIEIEFTYTFTNPRADASMNQTEKGTIVMSGDKYRLQFMGIDRLFDGKKIYTFLHEDKEVQIMDAEDDDEGFTPSFILDLYKQGFSYAMGGTSTQNGKRLQHIMLKSLNSAEIDNIEIVIFADTKQLQRMVQKGRNGGVTTFVVNQYKNLPTTPNMSFNRRAYMAKNYLIVE